MDIPNTVIKFEGRVVKEGKGKGEPFLEQRIEGGKGVVLQPWENPVPTWEVSRCLY